MTTELSQCLIQFADNDWHFAKRRSSHSTGKTLDLIHASGRANFDSILIAELLLKDVELNEKKGNISQAIVSRLQAFCLLVDSIKFLGPEEQVEYRKKLDTIASDLESVGEDPYIRDKVAGYLSAKATVQ